jgi:dihydrodipicolinate synthase/N-acetylneuraminate lyase
VVGTAAGLPLFVYNLPQSTGVEITPELMQKIKDGVPQLKGLKHSAPTFMNVRLFSKMGLDCLIGSGALMLPALTIGASGCVDGPPCYAPELWVEIRDAYRAGDMPRAQAAQDRASEATMLARQYGIHGLAKFILSERLGIDCGNPRPPGMPLSARQREEVRRRIEELGLSRVAVAHSDD